MVAKHRVSDLASELNVDKKDILNLIDQYFEGDKKPKNTLTPEEASVILEHFSQKNQVDNFNKYFETGANERAEKKKEEVKAAQAQENSQKSNRTEKKEVQNNNNTPTPKLASNGLIPNTNKPRKNTFNNPNNNNNNPDNREVKTLKNQNTTSRNGNFEQRPASNDNRSNNQNGTNNNQGRPQNNSGQNPVRQNNAIQNRFAQNNTVQKPRQPQQPKVPTKPREHFETVKPTGGLGEAITPDSKLKHVDTRGSYVELDKYNEKYEQIATPKHALKDNVSTKQKISQKHGRNRRYRKDTEADKLKKIEMEKQRRATLKITLPEEIAVGDLALKLKVTAAEIIKKLMLNGVMASISDIIDYDTASLVAMEIGAKVEREVVVTIEERLIDQTEDIDDALEPRSPVVVVMGHVDHGKTSLLDAIRQTSVIKTEAGGITQHIGAYRVKINDRYISFLDTPGHAAFTSMRARGAQVTDIAILVVAADDGIMPQTVEAINHAKAAGVTIIVAINKIDRPAANIEKVKAELAEHDLVCEDWGGETICVPVSALKNENIDTLLEMVQLVADVKELKANPNRNAKGTVIESKLDKGKGPVATVLVQNGTLRIGDIVICGMTVGRIRAMTNDLGESVEEAGPSVPVEIIGLAEVPDAGDSLDAVSDEKLARELAEQRRTEQKEERFAAYQKVTLDNLFSQIEQGEVKELPIIIKADVQGSVEAIKQSLEKLSCEEVRVRVIHGGVGAVTESDVMLASASNAIIVGFNVRPEQSARDNAKRDEVDIRLYRVIYDAINEIETAMKGMLAPKYRDVDLGRAEVRLIYKISNVGTIAGCYVTEGKIARNAHIRIVRDGIIVADDKLSSLKRFKDDAKEVAQGYECGMSLEKFNDIREGDFFEAYIIEEYRD